MVAEKCCTKPQIKTTSIRLIEYYTATRKSFDSAEIIN